MDRTVEVVEGLLPELLARVLERIFELEPTTIAILVSGSYAKRTTDEQSDLDVQVVTGETRRARIACGSSNGRTRSRFTFRPA
jgi:predicted nucleotidyltransferase